MSLTWFGLICAPTLLKWFMAKATDAVQFIFSFLICFLALYLLRNLKALYRNVPIVIVAETTPIAEANAVQSITYSKSNQLSGLLSISACLISIAIN